jgi:hypothetical protein
VLSPGFLAALAVLDAAGAVALFVGLLRMSRRWATHRCPILPRLEMRVFVDGCDQPVFQASTDALYYILQMDGLEPHDSNCQRPCLHWTEFMNSRPGAVLHYEFRRIP